VRPLWSALTALDQLRNIICRDEWSAALLLVLLLAHDATRGTMFAYACGQHGALETVFGAQIACLAQARRVSVSAVFSLRFKSFFEVSSYGIWTIGYGVLSAFHS